MRERGGDGSGGFVPVTQFQVNFNDSNSFLIFYFQMCYVFDYFLLFIILMVFFFLFLEENLGGSHKVTICGSEEVQHEIRLSRYKGNGTS